jgi:GrpB-like predicted nucleotidyltransferase (UPF0157 family)
MSHQTKQIEVVPYNHDWPNMFEVESNLIKQALGPHCREIHHIGSTSIPGLASKEDLDILCIIHSLPSCLSLQEAGYVFKGELNIPLRYYFSKNSPTSKVNLHVVEEGHGFIALNLCFRDYLRNHKVAREAYQNLKYQLLKDPTSFARAEGGFPRYTLEKDFFIKSILDQAGFTGITINFCTHYREWDAYHRICEEQIFRPMKVTYDRNHSKIQAKNHYHLVLYKGTQIVTVAHVEFSSAQEVLLHLLATDTPYYKQGYDAIMMEFIEKWLKHHGRFVTKLHGS